MYSVTLAGFRTRKQAKAFLDWYEGMGEQSFDDYLDIAELPSEDGCNVDVSRKGNKGRYYDETFHGYYAEVK